MRIQSYRETFALRAENIDAFSETLETILTGIEMERQNRLRIRLSLEEAMLRMRDRYGEDAEVEAVIGSRFRRAFIQLDLEGDPFNPLSNMDSKLEDWSSSLLTSVGLSPRYSYSGRKNSLKLTLPIQGMNPVLKLVIAIVAGILLGLIGNLMLSDQIQTSLTNIIMVPLYDVWNRILNVLSGPVIFFMTITTVLNTGKITERGGDSKGVIARYFIISIIISLIAIIVAAILFRPEVYGAEMNKMLAKGLFDQILRFVPGEFFSPFMESNTPQLLVMALVLGNALNVIGDQASRLSSVIKQINMIGLLLAEWVSRLVPFFVFFLIAYEIWERRTGLLVGIWNYLIVSIVLSVVIMMCVILIVGARKRVSPGLLIKKVWEPFALTIRAGSLNESFGLSEQCCIRKLGINREYTIVSLPQGLVLYMPISMVGTIIFTVFAARYYNIQVSVVWYVMAAILAVVLFVATPPVPGANLLAYTVIFVQLGIPSGALIDAMVFDIVFGLFASAANQVLLQMELIEQADKIGLLNRLLLRKAD